MQVFSFYVFKPIQILSKLHQIKSVHQTTLRVCSQIWVLYRAGCDKSCICSLGKKILLCKDSCKSSIFFLLPACCWWAVSYYSIIVFWWYEPGVPALREGVLVLLVLFLDSGQMFCSNKPNSAWFLTDLETVVLQKAIQWFFFFVHVKSYAAVALLQLSLVFSLWQERLKDFSCSSLVIIEILSEYKGLTDRVFILWSVNIRIFITQEYINPPNQHG